MRIQLSEHFTFKKLLRFVLPSVVMMVFTSVYTIVDGFFVSNYAGKVPLAAINLIYPICGIMGTFGFIFGTGGTAVVAYYLGQQKREDANRYFSLFIYAAIAVGLVMTLIGEVFMPDIAVALGADDPVLLANCVLYGRVLTATNVAFMLQVAFNSFFVTAEKPHLGLAVSLGAGIMNMFLDFTLVALLDLGLLGAALATALSQVLGAAIGLVYFSVKNSSLLRLGRTRFYGRILLKGCTNGASEFMTNIAMSVVTILYNYKLMALAGADGVAAFCVIGYVSFVFMAIYFGYAMGSAPIVSYHYGAGNTDELKNLFKKSQIIMAAAGITLTVIGIASGHLIADLFVGYDEGLMRMTMRGCQIFAFSYLFSGFNVYGTSFFTALNNGLVSGILAFLRSLVFQIISVEILAALFGVDGVWFSYCLTEIMALLVTLFCYGKYRRRYGFL